MLSLPLMLMLSPSSACQGIRPVVVASSYVASLFFIFKGMQVLGHLIIDLQAIDFALLLLPHGIDSPFIVHHSILLKSRAGGSGWPVLAKSASHSFDKMTSCSK